MMRCTILSDYARRHWRGDLFLCNMTDQIIGLSALRGGCERWHLSLKQNFVGGLRYLLRLWARPQRDRGRVRNLKADVRSPGDLK